MQEKSYKLGQYKIVELGEHLYWESHFGVGGARRGSCVEEGDFLIIGPPEVVQSGFLKTEFMDHLDKLPIWGKTRYYCFSHAVFFCETGRRMAIMGVLDGSAGGIESSEGEPEMVESKARRIESGSPPPNARDVLLKFKTKFEELRELFKFG